MGGRRHSVGARWSVQSAGSQAGTEGEVAGSTEKSPSSGAPCRLTLLSSTLAIPETLVFSQIWPAPQKHWGKLFYLQLELFAYS